MRWISPNDTVIPRVETLPDFIETIFRQLKLTSAKERDRFLNPPQISLPDYKKAGLSETSFRKCKNIIQASIKKRLPIIVYGDYDVDGVCATAIVWECLDRLGANAHPFIPSRENEGYGLSIAGIDNIRNNPKYKLEKGGLIIAVDSGIVAHEAVKYARTNNLEVIIVDHHDKPKSLPKADAILHTTKLCAAGIAFFLAFFLEENGSADSAVELATLATITDIIPLTDISRTIVKQGLSILNKTNRVGLKVLYETAGIKSVGVYEVGYLIGPRLNASGRLESAMDALRLLCTHNRDRAIALAKKLNDTNRLRQEMVTASVEDAIRSAEKITAGERIIIVASDKYHQGIIGLIAGKLTEKFNLPAIAISLGEKTSKGSARSITGYNIIQAIKLQERILINAGGHPAAAGFTIKTELISELVPLLSDHAKKTIAGPQLEKTLVVNCEVSLKNTIAVEIVKFLQQLAPFGNGNIEPVLSSTMTIKSVRNIGADGKHLKLGLQTKGEIGIFEAVFFNHGSLLSKLREGQEIFVAYNLAVDTFQNQPRIQMRIRDLKTG